LIATDLIALVADHVPLASAHLEVADETCRFHPQDNASRLERELMMANSRPHPVTRSQHRSRCEIERRAVSQLEPTLR